MQIFSMHMSNYGNTLQIILKFTLYDSRAESERKICMRESERANVQYRRNWSEKWNKIEKKNQMSRRRIYLIAFSMKKKE